MAIRKLPIGIQSFEKIRTENYLYIDKTKHIWNLVQNGSVYFLSRPRRFGKSLLVSTMEAYFRGKKELFKGLAIEELENSRGEDAWIEYPVITFSLSGGEYNEKGGLEVRLHRTLSIYEDIYDVDPGDYDLSNRFAFLIEKIYEKTGRHVVVLVDEYDKPLLETMVINEEQEEKNRRLYKGFFSVLKDADQYLEFVFFTGVTKFSKVSIFSDLNQLYDISLSPAYGEICGITEQELNYGFSEEIKDMADSNDITACEAMEKLKAMYDGYHFSRNSAGMYNPFSLLQALQEKDFGSYWFESGTPTFLVRKLEASDYMIEDYTEGITASETDISDYREGNPDPVPLFYQSGYLTIIGWDPEFRLFKLSFPNEEVKYGFLKSLLPSFFSMAASKGSLYVMNFVKDLRAGDADSFLTRLQALFAGIPYPEGPAVDYERDWRDRIFLVLCLLGQNVRCEVHTSIGRVDCVVETKDYVYVFEYKLDKDADSALAQINAKDYALSWQTDGRKVIKAGVSFSSEKRNIDDWKIETSSM